MRKYLSYIGILSIGTILYSCDYQSIGDAEYLPQQVYLPASVNGVYKVEDIAPDYGPVRYNIDLDARKLNIPLSVYRGGINNDGNVHVALEINNDSVNKLIAAGELLDELENNPELLPVNRMEIPSEVEISSGGEVSPFTMSVDLDFIMANPRTRYITGICINEADCSIASKNYYLIVEINTRFIVPKVLFSCRVIDDANYIVEFTNNSEYGQQYTWDFGDGTAIFEGEVPDNHQYPSNGQYKVKLTTLGITGDNFSYVYDLKLWENITSLYIANSGPFKRKDSGGKTGLLADWLYTDNVAGTSGKGGFYLESGGVMDFYNSSKALINAKVYQSFTLPAGYYRACFTPYSFKGTNNCYYLATTGTELPDTDNIEGNDAVLGYFNWSEDLGKETQEFEFEVKAESQVTIGFVVTNEAKARVQISNVALYR